LEIGKLGIWYLIVLRLALLIVFAFVALPVEAFATDRVITNPKLSKNDARFDYPLLLIRSAMERTEARYGTFTIERFSSPLTRARALKELGVGNVTVFVAPTRPAWEAAAIPIRIPIRKGILGYKLLLIHQDDQARFNNVRTLDDLKTLRLGSGSQWSSSAAYRKLGFKVYGGSKYEPLFGMLAARRFDYFPRGVNEVFAEMEARKDSHKTLVVAAGLAVYIPQPSYFFVSPKYPQLAKRLQTGLEAMQADGTLERLFWQYHRSAIEKADLKNRRIIKMENRNLPLGTPFEKSHLWFDPSS
jgi:hypothetical protein